MGGSDADAMARPGYGDPAGMGWAKVTTRRVSRVRFTGLSGSVASVPAVPRLPWFAIALLIGCLVLLGYSAEEHFPTASGTGAGTTSHSAGLPGHHPGEHPA